jgi:DDE superfamily endonuclease/Winged helix-turn helix
MPILPAARFAVTQRLLRQLRRCDSAGHRARLLIVVNLLEGRRPLGTAHTLKVRRDTVCRVARRFRQHGAVGPLDRRAGNGPGKLTPAYRAAPGAAVRGSPQGHGYRRPTWARELLRLVLLKRAGVAVHAAALSRAPKRVRARRGRPRPTAGCPRPQARKRRRLARTRRLVEGLPRDEAAAYEDEVGTRLNPKVGPGWMGCGQQKEVRTPGQNRKPYLAGALDVRSRAVIRVGGDKKGSRPFVQLLGEPYHRYPRARRAHVILDNYGTHDSRLVAWALLEAGGRIKLRPLPPYCPEHNPIERAWEGLHAEVTRNRTCPDMDELPTNVRVFLLVRYFRILDQAEDQRHAQAS